MPLKIIITEQKGKKKGWLKIMHQDMKEHWRSSLLAITRQFAISLPYTFNLWKVDLVWNQKRRNSQTRLEESKLEPWIVKQTFSHIDNRHDNNFENAWYSPDDNKVLEENSTKCFSPNFPSKWIQEYSHSSFFNR